MRTAVQWLTNKWRGEGLQHELAGAYAAVFGGGNRAGELIRADLAKFCHATQSTLRDAANDREAFANEGMRAVYLHICAMAAIDPTEIPAPARED
jgi:hypothetical protein